ncbi:MAG: N-acetylneuraminate synthase family protein [Coxiellaceae bacterium]|nr:N-acetylneuraminate synthase family protein [Coxiellaceae bacterium]
MDKQTVKIIGEAEINHNGDVELAKQLVDMSKDCGADYVKFQCFSADGFIAPGSSFLDIFKSNELSLDEFKSIKQHADAIGIEMISTASGLDGLAMIAELDLPIVKLGSTNITNYPLLQATAELKKTVYLSTGASTLGEIEEALNIIYKHTNDITLFHCSVQYPARDEILNLRAIQTMQSAFPGIPVAYSDHSIGNIAANIAVAYGVKLFEKHITLDNNLPGPDHAFSVNPDQFSDYVTSIHRAESMLGNGRKHPTQDEMQVRVSGRRYLTSTSDIKAKQAIDASMIKSRRVDIKAIADPAALLPPKYEKQIQGWVAKNDIPAGSAIILADLLND